MDDFLKVTAGVMIALLLYLILSKQGKDFAILLTVAVCCMVVAIAASFLEPILDFVDMLISLGNFDTNVLQILLKSVGIGLLTEVTSLICADAGNASLGKSLQILASVVILWLAIPLFTALIDTVEEILVAL